MGSLMLAVAIVKQKLDKRLAGLIVRATGTKVGVGDPVERIVAALADHGPIVVSDSGKSRLKRFLISSVAFGVMGRAKTSVLNVR